ncbi:type III secretion protein T [Pseudomonas sp. JUb42]|jgi:type III secretion protein T|uniref:type III secretion system export apparatus subunit SctT n=1 Tax=Pseudomonas sp. JUb42 TaxID=2940611 RepID=UPI00216753C4|nr:type III secretion system export apparatus subunit SctT [Pseudomonas sp. JUb42]MCS3466955.1 type III secretion protein T [Pseudomonas sp. JUb42]
MDAALVNTFLEVAYPVISSAALSASRAMGLVVITPAFNRLGLTGMIRGCVAVAISVPMFLPTFTAFTSMPEHGSFWLAGLLIKEFLIGLLVGLLFGIPFWAAEVAGELIDLQRGSTMAQLVDPLSSGESSVMATLLTVMLITLFFMSGGFILMVDGYFHSYQLWPVTAFTPLFASSALLAVLSILDQVMRIGVLMVSPLIISLLVTDLMLAYLSRMAPSLHIFDLSLPVKNLFFTILMVIYIGFLIPLMLDQLAEFRGTVELLKSLVGDSHG